MATKHFVLIDSTPESRALAFANDSKFQSWLRTYTDVSEALQFLSTITLPYSIQIFLARDNIYSPGLPSETNGRSLTLLQTLCGLQAIHHISVFSPDISESVIIQIRSLFSNQQIIKEILSVNELHSYLCCEGINYFQQQITHRTTTQEFHLIRNFRRNRAELIRGTYQDHTEQGQHLQVLEDEYSDKRGVQQS
ncbi:hypothetical protein I4U23_029851 [Adineta vaga]|nr:hypothetical protein I4U23_029851 [Adineta vaga]